MNDPQRPPLTGPRGWWWRHPAVGAMLTFSALWTLACIAIDASIRHYAPLGHWAIWGGCVVVVDVLWWAGRRAERRLAAAIAGRNTGDPPEQGSLLARKWLDPARRGPHIVFLRDGNRHIQLRTLVVPTGHGDLWMLYGPAGMEVPPDGELLILSDHHPTGFLIETEEVKNAEGDIITVFGTLPSAEHTPN